MRIEQDLIDQLFNSSEKRLARVLLLFAQFGKEAKPEPVVPKVSQEVLAASEGAVASFTEIGPVELKGVSGTVRLHAAHRLN